MTSTGRPDLPERLAIVETTLRYETQRIDRLEQKVASSPSQAPRFLSMLDGAASIKLLIAGLLALAMVALNATGHPEQAAKLSSVLPGMSGK